MSSFKGSGGIWSCTGRTPEIKAVSEEGPDVDVLWFMWAEDPRSQDPQQQVLYLSVLRVYLFYTKNNEAEYLKFTSYKLYLMYLGTA